MTDIILPKSTNIKNLVRVSHALAFTAGDLATDIAQLWPFPHTGFLERSSPWMHIAAMAISNVISSNRNARIAFDATYCWKRGAEFADPRFNQTNRCILKSLSLPLWRKRDYRNLSNLLESPNGLKVLKHQKTITPHLVNTLHALPERFRANAIIQHLGNQEEASILNQIVSIDTDKAQALFSKLRSANDVNDFWSKASSFFLDQCARFPAPPKIDDPRVKSIVTVDELRSYGTGLRLCLRNLLGEALSGEQAYYLFNGTEPVVVSIAPRIGGAPVIDQMSAKGNNAVSDSDRQVIIDVFSKAGVRDESNFVNHWPSELDRRLHRLGSELGSGSSEKLYSKINELIEIGLQSPASIQEVKAVHDA